MDDVSTIRPDVLSEVRDLLRHEGSTEAALQSVLDRVLDHFGCAAGTVHRWDAAAGILILRAVRNIPPALLDRIRQIPLGKGMAGIAAERREPVQVCNLQSDSSGVARPGAKETRMEGSIAVPMLVDGSLRGVLGVAKPVAYEFTPAESALLLQIGESIGSHL
ncbi:MAG TPA: GAF domain-containing protein [Gemmataceae bacterium]|nr:GAF domain-containing protein [Gemmataceae bacterium]